MSVVDVSLSMRQISEVKVEVFVIVEASNNISSEFEVGVIEKTLSSFFMQTLFKHNSLTLFALSILPFEIVTLILLFIYTAEVFSTWLALLSKFVVA